MTVPSGRFRCLVLFLLCLILLTSSVFGATKGPATGVESELAKQRKKSFADPEYRLKAVIPLGKSDPVMADLELVFTALKRDNDLILDFTPAEEAIRTITLNGRPVPWRSINEHIVIAAEQLIKGQNVLHCSFQMGDMSLNRRDDLLYTLFVPDRARTAFPCFDQPDLKGRFAVELDIPADWDAVANGPLLSSEKKADGRNILRFAPSHPLPTYLMAFVAGRLQRVEEKRDGRQIHIFHQETDSAALDRNIPVIFDQVFSSLAWMERYTGIEYPFDKYDLILVPSFQYGGMEHCGATLYRASHLILDEQATLEQRLSRSGLIAHETAHMWFGDLVTMPWFDEVWIKEVFAGFMADKMVADLYPDIDHQLKFLLGHNPFALSIDRSGGTHPITQGLDNLADAGTLYGHLIYHKAPIVMDQLERRVGSERMRLALGQYLRENAYGNAGWDPLIELLAQNDPGIRAWSHNWVYEAGLPSITVRRDDDRVWLSQSDESGRNRLWSQHMGIVVQKGDQSRLLEISFENTQEEIALSQDLGHPDLVLPAGNGAGYGRIFLDRRSYGQLLSNPMSLPHSLWRGAAWLTLMEGSLDGYVRPYDLIKCVLSWIESETDPLLLERLLGDLPTLFWRLLKPKQREALALECETRVWNEMHLRPESQRMAFFDAYRRLGSSSGSVRRLLNVLARKEQIDGVSLSEKKELSILLNLAILSPPELDTLLNEVPQKWTSADQKEQLNFLRPLFSVDPEIWLRFFTKTLAKLENREKEPWVLSALSLIHHPLRAEKTRALITETLAMLPEIQRTGDIFFPIGWVGETLWGHQSAEAAGMVKRFLETKTTLSKPLRLKVLQGADLLLRQNRPDELRIRNSVEGLSSLPRPRNVANPEMLERAAQIIEKQLREQGWKVSSQKFPYSGGTARNISVLWGGEMSSRLVIGAHYDVCGDTPGADDNASGVSVLLELAEKLIKRPVSSDRAVELVFYSLEEPPYFGTRQMGSFIHARSLMEAKKKVNLMISVDMVGYYADARSYLAVIGRKEDSTLLKLIASVLSSEVLLGVEALPLPSTQKGLDWSDHRNYWAHGYPALMLHSCPFFQNPHYHRPGDRPEILDYPRLSALSRALFNLIELWPFR